MNAEQNHDDQGDGHDDALDEVGGGGGQKSAQSRIRHDHNAGNDHGGHVIHAEQTVEQLSAGGEAGGGVGMKKIRITTAKNPGQNALFISKALGEEL